MKDRVGFTRIVRHAWPQPEGGGLKTAAARPIPEAMARALLVLTFSLALLALVSPAAHAARPLDLPAETSILFSLTADGGTLTPAKGKDRFILTLRKVDRRAVWFTDRPARKSGALGSRALFGAWARLGFAKDPPNAALTVLRGRRTSDAVAVELGTPRYNVKARTVRFSARALPGATGGLEHLRRKVDDRVPQRFGEAALFIDDASSDWRTECTMGATSLFAGRQIAPTMTQANGATLGIDEDPPLYAMFEDTFGGGPTSFVLPTIPAPAQMTYATCLTGTFPSGGFDPEDPGMCSIGQITLAPTGWSGSGRLPADGRQVPVATYGTLATLLGAGPETITLPRVPSPLPGLSAYICSSGQPPSEAGCWIGEVRLFGSSAAMPGSFTPADGRLLEVPTTSVWNNMLFSLLSTGFGGDGLKTYGLPNLPGPAPGTAYGVCLQGTYPTGAFWS
jgi:microcystin-dependent protein